jgi:hypothetical protein
MQTAKTNKQAVPRGECAHAESFGKVRTRIGSTVYEVHLHFNQDAKETMNDKLLRIIRNDLNSPSTDGNMAVPQTNRLSERSSV